MRTKTEHTAVTGPGTRPGIRSQRLISTGQAELDRILGGGLPLGNVFVILHDSFTPHHDTLLKCASHIFPSIPLPPNPLVCIMIYSFDSILNNNTVVIYSRTKWLCLKLRLQYLHCHFCRCFVAEGLASNQAVHWACDGRSQGDPFNGLPRILMPSERSNVSHFASSPPMDSHTHACHARAMRCKPADLIKYQSDEHFWPAFVLLCAPLDGLGFAV